MMDGATFTPAPTPTDPVDAEQPKRLNRRQASKIGRAHV
mgnify:CR=1 FL=1